jgi:hypothetical protein
VERKAPEKAPDCSPPVRATSHPSFRERKTPAPLLAENAGVRFLHHTCGKHGPMPGLEPTERWRALHVYDASATAASVVEISRWDLRQ